MFFERKERTHLKGNEKAATRMGLVERLLPEEDRKLLSHAELVDKIDRIIGPLESTLQIYGNPFWASVGWVLEMSELLFLKAPFIMKYLQRTKDYDALVSWLPREIIATMVPYGDFIDIMNAYKNRARQYYEQQLSEELSLEEEQD